MPTKRLGAWLQRRVMRLATRKGIDLSRLDAVPETLAWPLRRDRFDPPARLAEVRAEIGRAHV